MEAVKLHKVSRGGDDGSAWCSGFSPLGYGKLNATKAVVIVTDDNALLDTFCGSERFEFDAVCSLRLTNFLM